MLVSIGNILKTVYININMNKTLLLSLVVASVIGSNNMQLKANLESFEKVFEPLVIAYVMLVLKE